ncbi:hypothetical protein EVA_11738 [gut metagenome]|uniref:Uncharacterized protein n=1 Tax=gut metagenome TaxID=749906 RepID=J9FYW1_9ZZZZ
MQKYVESAAQGMDQAASASALSSEVLKANKEIIEAFDVKMKEFAAYQKLASETMEKLQETILQQGEKQEALFSELSQNMQELSKHSQKGKFRLFK